MLVGTVLKTGHKFVLEEICGLLAKLDLLRRNEFVEFDGVGSWDQD